MQQLVEFALEILSEPQVSDEAVRSQVRSYLSDLDRFDYVELESEALADRSDIRADRMQILTQLGMSPREVYEYSKYKLSSEDVRKAIAWRAVLAKRLGWTAEQLREEHFLRLEMRELLGDIRQLSVEDAIKELQNGK